MRFRIMRFSIYAVLGNGPNSCFMRQYSHIMRFLVKIIVYKILLIFFLHLCDSCIMRFLLGNKKRINGELSVFSRIRHGAKLRPCFDDQAQFDVLNLDLKSSQLYFPTSISVMYMISLTTNLRI